MSGGADPGRIIDPILNRLNPDSGNGAQPGQPGGKIRMTDAAIARLNPATSYTARERPAGSNVESQARQALEDEKRRRYDRYRQTLLGSVPQPQPAGAPNPDPEPDYGNVGY